MDRHVGVCLEKLRRVGMNKNPNENDMCDYLMATPAQQLSLATFSPMLVIKQTSPPSTITHSQAQSSDNLREHECLNRKR